MIASKSMVLLVTNLPDTSSLGFTRFILPHVYSTVMWQMFFPSSILCPP